MDALRVSRDHLEPQERVARYVCSVGLRLKDEDLDELLMLVPPEEHTQLRENFREWRHIAAHNAEQMTS